MKDRNLTSFRIITGIFLIIFSLVIISSISTLPVSTPVGKIVDVYIKNRLNESIRLVIGLFLTVIGLIIIFVPMIVGAVESAAVERGTKEFGEKTALELEGELMEPMPYYLTEKTTLNQFIGFLKKSGFNYDAIVDDNRKQLFDAVLNLKYMPGWETISEIARKLGIKTKEDFMHKFGPGTKRLHLRAYIDREDLKDLEKLVRTEKISMPGYENLFEKLKSKTEKEKYHVLGEALFKYLKDSDIPIRLLITAHTETNWPPLGFFENAFKSIKGHLKKGQGNYKEGSKIMDKLLDYKDKIMQEKSPYKRYEIVKGIVDYISKYMPKYSRFSHF